MQNFPISAAQRIAIREQSVYLAFDARPRPTLAIVDTVKQPTALTAHQLAAQIFADKYADETFITSIDVMQRLNPADREQAAALAKAMGGDVTALRRLYLKLAKGAAQEEAIAELAGEKA